MILVRGDVVPEERGYIDHYNPDAWIENDAHRDFPPADDNAACASAGVAAGLARGPGTANVVVPDVENNKLFVFSRVENHRTHPVQRGAALRGFPGRPSCPA